MRHIVMAVGLMVAGALAVTTGLVVTGAVAGEEAAAPDRSTWSDDDRLRVLELEMQVTRARLQAVSAYVLANQERAAGLEQLAAQCRRQGFTGGAISSTSRETLLRGIVALAKSLRDGLPVISEDEAEMNAALADLLGAAEKRKPRKASETETEPAPEPTPAPAPEDDDQ